MTAKECLKEGRSRLNQAKHEPCADLRRMHLAIARACLHCARSKGLAGRATMGAVRLEVAIILAEAIERHRGSHYRGAR